MQILVLEASTTSAKAMVYNTSNRGMRVLAEPYPRASEDATVHDADAVVATVTRLARRISRGTTIAAVAMVGAWHGLFLADRNLRPISPVYLWSNTEPAPICRRLRQDKELVDWFYHATGCMVNATYPAFMLLLFQERGVALQDALILDEGSYLNWLLTGELIQTQCLASGSGLLNAHNRRYDRGALAMVGVTEDQLPRLVPSSGYYPLSSLGAKLLGLPAGTPVLPTIADGASNQVGAGALRPGVMTLSVGTSGAIRVATDSPRIPRNPSTWCYVSTSGWLSGAATAGACNCIDWFRDNVSGTTLSYRQLEGAGFDGGEPIFLPFLHGERCPGWNDERRGEFVGLRAGQDVVALYRSVQEGVLFNLYQCYSALTELNGPSERLKLSGGILNSQRWTQMCADVFGLNLEVDAALHASLLGGAVLGMEILGVIAHAADYEGSPVKVVTPNLRSGARHRDRYREYLDAYQSGEP